MRHILIAAVAALVACGGSDGVSESAGETAGDVGATGAGGGGTGTPAPPPEVGPADLVLGLSGQGTPTADVKGFRLAARKVAFHFGRPTEPLFDGVLAEPVACEASAATFVRDAPADAHVEFGSTDSRLRLAGIDLDRGALLVEAWILVARGSAEVERPTGQLRSVRLPVCKDEDGTIWSVVRGVPSRQLVVTDGAEATATIDLRASSFIVDAAACTEGDAPAECASAEDEGDDGDPGTRLVYTLHSLAIR